MTEDKSNTLAPETLQALATLPEKVTAIAFYSTSLDSSSAEELLLKFKTNSKGKFDYTFVDPDQDPVAAREAGITGDGKIMLQMGETKEIASFASETELTTHADPPDQPGGARGVFPCKDMANPLLNQAAN